MASADDDVQIRRTADDVVVCTDSSGVQYRIGKGDTLTVPAREVAGWPDGKNDDWELVQGKTAVKAAVSEQQDQQQQAQAEQAAATAPAETAEPTGAPATTGEAS